MLIDLGANISSNVEALDEALQQGADERIERWESGMSVIETIVCFFRSHPGQSFTSNEAARLIVAERPGINLTSVRAAIPQGYLWGVLDRSVTDGAPPVCRYFWREAPADEDDR